MKRLILFLAFILVAASCGSTRNDEAQDDTDLSADEGGASTGSTLEPITDESIAADLTFEDGETIEISRDELDEFVKSVEELDFLISDTSETAINAQALNTLIYDAFITQELEKESIEISNSNISAAEESLSQELDTLIASSGREVTSQEIFDDNNGLIAITVNSSAGIEALIDVFVDEVPEEVISCSRHILKTTDSPEGYESLDQAAKDELEAQAQEILEQLQNGADFAQLAMEESDGPSGPSGGDLGCVQSSNFVAPFAEFLDKGEIGVGGPVETEFGWHVIELLEVRGQTDEEKRATATTLANNAFRGNFATTEVRIATDLGVWTGENVQPALDIQETEPATDN